MIVNQRAIDLLKRLEGCELRAYQDVVGIWTIGYGTTAAAGMGITPHAGMTITQAQADALLERTVDDFAASVARLITAPVTQNEFGACVLLAYNIGVNAFQHSTVLRELNKGNKAAAGNAFHMWNKAGGRVVNGLINRRELEHQLFNSPDPVRAAPAPIITKDNAQGSILVRLLLVILSLFGSKK